MKGTILSLLVNDLFSMIRSQNADEIIDCSHYPFPQKVMIFHLVNKEFNAFDRLEVRTSNLLNPDLPPSGVSIYLSSSTPISDVSKLEIINKIQSIYGEDNFKKGNLKKNEKANLMAGKGFHRSWDFNQFHSINHFDYPGDISCYSVEISDYRDEGLIVTVHHFREDLLDVPNRWS
jgi:hypothetical protein